ncbi:MAG: hypothetical protein ACW986_10890 [Promethearchaeota archaeon]|jgi:chromosome segregation protein
MSDDNLEDMINNLNKEVYGLKRQITNLETDLNNREIEVYKHLETIENLEDYIMKVETLIPSEDETKKSKKQKNVGSKLTLKLEQKEREIRDLKDRMGFLRKEKTQIQRELEKLKAMHTESNVIRTEDLRAKPPLETLVKDLQDKVNKQKSLLENLKSESIDLSEFDDKVKEKEKAIERRMANFLQAQIDDQTKIIELKNKEIEELKKDAELMKGKLEVIEVQMKIKDQRSDKQKKKSKKKKT